MLFFYTREELFVCFDWRDGGFDWVLEISETWFCLCVLLDLFLPPTSHRDLHTKMGGFLSFFFLFFPFPGMEDLFWFINPTNPFGPIRPTRLTFGRSPIDLSVGAGSSFLNPITGRVGSNPTRTRKIRPMCSPNPYNGSSCRWLFLLGMGLFVTLVADLFDFVFSAT